jgi:periplasmic protein TonB
MFDHVLGRGVPKRRFGTGALIGLVLHGGLVAAVLSVRVDLEPPPPDDLGWPTVVPTGGLPTPPRSGAGKARGERQPISRPRPPVVVGADVRLTLLAHQEQPPPKTTATSGDGLLREEDAEGRGDGEQASGERGSCTGDDCGHAAEYGLKCSDDSPCTMGANLSAPVLLQGDDPEYTKEALAAGVEGMMEVSCVLTREGTVRDCSVVRPLPFMDGAVVKALTSRRYVPAKLLGDPVAVQYLFHVRLVLPAGEAPRRVAPPSAPIPL